MTASRPAIWAAANGEVDVHTNSELPTCPLYLADLAPAHRRGRTVTISELMIVTGQMLAFEVNAWTDHVVKDPHV